MDSRRRARRRSKGHIYACNQTHVYHPFYGVITYPSELLGASTDSSDYVSDSGDMAGDEGQLHGDNEG